MSYLPLARRYRPQQFDELIGQEHVATTLKNAVAANRVAQAYLFAGPRGVGKTSAARILAKALNCQQGPTPTPCQTCPSCEAITAGRSLDVLEIDGASNRGIDQIRELREQVKFVPTQGTFRVYIIDEVHQITSDGFNALLKTLEEPPPHIRFVFATTAPQKVPATILSRCQRFEFRRIPMERIVEVLRRIAGEERLTLEEAALYEIARAAEGGLRDAESILDQVACTAEEGEAIRAETVTAMVGALSVQALGRLMERVGAQDAAACLEMVNEFVLSGRDLGQCAQALAEYLRHLLIARSVSEPARLIWLSAESVQQIVQQCRVWSVTELIDTLDLWTVAQETMRRSINARIPMELALVRMATRHLTAASSSTSQSAQPKDRTPSPAVSSAAGVRSAATPVRSAPAPSAKPSAPASPSPRAAQAAAFAPSAAAAEPLPVAQDDPASSPSISVEQIKQMWPELLRRVEAGKASRASFLAEAEPVRTSGSTVVLGIPRTMGFHKEMLERPADRQAIEAALGQLLNAKVSIQLMLVESTQHVSVDATAQFFKGTVVPFGPAPA